MHARKDPRPEGTRLAETCGARDESPSSNLCRVKQEEASRADVMKPNVGGRMA